MKLQTFSIFLSYSTVPTAGKLIKFLLFLCTDIALQEWLWWEILTQESQHQTLTALLQTVQCSTQWTHWINKNVTFQRCISRMPLHSSLWPQQLRISPFQHHLSHPPFPPPTNSAPGFRGDIQTCKDSLRILNSLLWDIHHINHQTGQAGLVEGVPPKAGLGTRWL